jgi:hypothetical protein
MKLLGFKNKKFCTRQTYNTLKPVYPLLQLHCRGHNERLNVMIITLANKITIHNIRNHTRKTWTEDFHYL